jgi:DNA (cytosine-5)-methyltransferase 1
MPAYYNDIDAYACEWLRRLIAEGLIAPGHVDQRDIRDVQPEDVAGYSQCHFFAGLGGWPYALQLAGWGDRPVWTASPPCQPFSLAGKHTGHGDEQHLWPSLSALIRERKPPVLFGEQVARAIGMGWLDAVAADLEAQAYAVGAAVLPACSVGAPHIRSRLWFVAYADAGRREVERLKEYAEQQSASRHQPDGRRTPGRGNGAHVADAGTTRLSLSEQSILRSQVWHEKGRATTECYRWSAEPDVGRMAHGIPGRVGKLRALGNAIVPQVAAQFIKASMR